MNRARKNLRPWVDGAATNVRMAYASAAALCLVGVFFLLRANGTLQAVLGFGMLLSAISVAVGTRTASTKRDQ